MSEDAALAHFRAHREGTLIADDLPSRLRFVSDPTTGRLVFPVPGATFAAENPVLFVPDETPDGSGELQLMLSVRELDPAHAACDRWKVYHGEPRLSRWASCAIEGAKFEGELVGHERMHEPNALAAAEPRLCKRLNADHAALAAACLRATGVEIHGPVAVGVDSGGIDVRARFGIVRLAFPVEAPAPEAAEAAIGALLGARA
jgi:hypothetical protein